MIEIKSVRTIKSGEKRFDDFTWTIRDGEHWVISGKNGSGKTMLLELLAGFIHPVQGEVIYDFIHTTSWDERFSERKKTIHYIPAHALQAFLSSHNLFYQQRYYTMGDERIPLVKEIFGEDMADLYRLGFPPSFGIDELLELPLTRLSNGQLKKVLILKNLTKGLPRLLLLDYPFEGLDHVSREELIKFIDHLANDHGITVILTDHDHHLPSVINRKLTLERFRIVSEEIFQPGEDITYEDTASGKEEISTRMPSVVEMNNVTIRYGEKEIIRNFNWTIRKGERWALTGKNGSGKTTLFSMIFADHPKAYSEKVYLFGKRRGSGESIWDIKARINYLGPELFSYMNAGNILQTAREYISRQLKNIPADELESALDKLPGKDFFDLPVKHLSSGQLQLMLTIISLLSEKELILLDEPFQFLDPGVKEWVTDYIQQHLHEETTLVLITHYEKDIYNWTRQRMHLSARDHFDLRT